MAGLPAAEPQETMRQDAALEEGAQLVLEKSRQLRSGVSFGVRDEAGCVLLYQSGAVPHGPVCDSACFLPLLAAAGFSRRHFVSGSRDPPRTSKGPFCMGRLHMCTYTDQALTASGVALE